MSSLIVVLLAALALACGGSPRAGAGQPARSGAKGSPSGLAFAEVPARGVLGYAVRLERDRLVSVELGERFELVVRSGEGEPLRVELGPPDWDVGDLAVRGDRAWVASRAGTVRAVDLTTGQIASTFHLGQEATAVAVSAAGSHLATGTAAGVLCLRRLPDGALLQCVAAHEAAVSSLDFAPDGGALVSASHDGTAVLWSVPALEVRGRRAGPRHNGSVNAARFAPDGDRIALAISDRPPIRTPEIARRERAGQPSGRGALEIWTPGSPATRCAALPTPLTSVTWIDPDHVVTGAWDRAVRLWTRGCEQIASLGGFAGIVTAVDGRGTQVAAAAWPRDLESPSVALIDLLYVHETPPD